ncbi:MAG: ribonuclease III [Elusimicrobiota bacterium]
MEKISKQLGIDFKDKSLLDKALLHSSYAAQHGLKKDNERLEFLGDSILNACVSIILYDKFPGKDEGELTQLRARIVSRKSLKKWGHKLNLEEHVLLGNRMAKHVKDRETHIIGDTVEAIIGAIYLDGGFQRAYDFINSYVRNKNFDKIMDFKSRLQELTVGRQGSIPDYETVKVEGPPHSRWFKVDVKIDGEVYGTGEGLTKKEAHQRAAKEAYAKLSNNKD